MCGQQLSTYTERSMHLRVNGLLVFVILILDALQDIAFLHNSGIIASCSYIMVSWHTNPIGVLLEGCCSYCKAKISGLPNITGTQFHSMLGALLVPVSGISLHFVGILCPQGIINCSVHICDLILSGTPSLAAPSSATWNWNKNTDNRMDGHFPINKEQ